ncbi:MAG: type secretion system protein [Marmoricola sp.]|nr:type secretion system protein [Marmoricola sp.]
MVAALCAASLVGLVGRPGVVVRRPDLRVLTGFVVAVAGVVAVRELDLHGGSAALVAMVAAAGAAVLQHLRRRRGRLLAERRSASVLATCDGLAADLQAGLPPVAALTAAAVDWPEFRTVADAAGLGADVPTALRTLAARPGAEPLRLVAGAWVVAHRSGAGLAASIGLAARTVREDRATARVVETELASALATARLLAVLPVGVLLIGRGAGGDPVGFLLGSTPGLLCLGCGLALEWSGLLWLERIADGIRRA